MTIRLKHLASLHGTCSSRHERPYVALEHVESWTGKLIERVELPVLAPASSGMATAEPGDVLFGKLRPYLAKSWVVDRPVVASTELMCIRPKPDLNSRWLGYLMSTVPFVEWASATSEGTRMPRTSWEKMSEYRPPLPPLLEQQAIADYLDIETVRIDALIANKRRMIHLLEERWRELRRVRVLRGLDPVRGGGLDEPWQEMNLGVLVELQRGHDLPSDDRIDGTIPVVSSGGVSGSHNIAIADGPGVVTGRYGTVGEVFFVHTPYWPLNTTLYVNNFRGNDHRWIYHLLASIPLDIDSQKSAVGGINRNIVGSLRVPMPPLSEQRAIAHDLDEAESLWLETRKAIQLQIHLFIELRQALISSIVTGEITVPEVAARASVTG